MCVVFSVTNKPKSKTCLFREWIFIFIWVLTSICPWSHLQLCRRSPLSATVCLKYQKNTLARGYSSSACPWSKCWTAFFWKNSPLALLFNCCFLLTRSFCSPWRFEIEIEPIFASLALYDVKEKKKVSCYAFLSPELLGHSCKPLKMLGGQNEFDEWTIKFYVADLLCFRNAGKSLELCIYLKRNIDCCFFLLKLTNTRG